MHRKIKVYIDTNIARDCLEGRDRSEESKHLMKLVQKNKWKCVTSIFLIMELADGIKDRLFFQNKISEGWTTDEIMRKRSNRDLTKSDFRKVETYATKIDKRYRFIEFFTLSASGWGTAARMSMDSNLSAPDIIHLATAWEARCNIIATKDDPFVEHAKKFLTNVGLWGEHLRICKPSEVVKNLEEMGLLQM